MKDFTKRAYERKGYVVLDPKDKEVLQSRLLVMEDHLEKANNELKNLEQICLENWDKIPKEVIEQIINVKSKVKGNVEVGLYYEHGLRMVYTD